MTGGPFVDFSELSNEPPPALPTSLPALDRVLGGGLRPGVLNVIAGSAASGKTNLVLTILASQPNLRVLCVQLDESARLFVPKYEAMARHPIDPSKFLVVDSGEPDLAELASWCDLAKARMGGVDFVLFDYLERFRVEGTTHDSSQSGRRRLQLMKGLIHEMTTTTWAVIHQSNAGGRYPEVMDLKHLNYGGGPEIDGACIGCWTKDPAKMTESERSGHPRMKINVMKNKWGLKQEHGVEYLMDSTDGYRVKPMVEPYRPPEVRYDGWG